VLIDNNPGGPVRPQRASSRQRAAHRRRARWQGCGLKRLAGARQGFRPAAFRLQEKVPQQDTALGCLCRSALGQNTSRFPLGPPRGPPPRRCSTATLLSMGPRAVPASFEVVWNRWNHTPRALRFLVFLVARALSGSAPGEMCPYACSRSARLTFI